MAEVFTSICMEKSQFYSVANSKFNLNIKNSESIISAILVSMRICSVQLEKKST